MGDVNMNRIREYRRKNGLTATELGELVGLSQSSISFIENGKRSPRIENLEKMADVFGCSVNDLIRKENYVPKKYKSTTFEPYYKLHYSFFNSREYKVLTVFCEFEETLAFLIMQAYSAKSKGVIKYDHTEEMTIISEIALDTNLEYHIAENALEAAEKAGLIKMTDEEIVFLDVQKQFSKRGE